MPRVNEVANGESNGKPTTPSKKTASGTRKRATPGKKSKGKGMEEQQGGNGEDNFEEYMAQLKAEDDSDNETPAKKVKREANA